MGIRGGRKNYLLFFIFGDGPFTSGRKYSDVAAAALELAAGKKAVPSLSGGSHAPQQRGDSASESVI
jgi:hypothetical protein